MTNYLHEISKALAEEKNVLLYGPPGTGKSYLMTEFRRSFLEPAGPILLDEGADTDFFVESGFTDRPCRKAWWVTFHQSYSYEDFVVGLRTAPGATFQLDAAQGPLLEAAENARIEDGASLILIDEINRGNTSKIFGEFITLMEPDKRLGADGSEGPQTVSVRLPYVPPQGFSFQLDRGCGDPEDIAVTADFEMPHHVFVLASMNSVDRSVAPLDAALRRRFHVIELEPDYELLASALELDSDPNDLGSISSSPDELVYWRRLALRLLWRINLRIRTLVGDDFQLGHSYFLPLRDSEDVPQFKAQLATILNRRIVPQLEEMMRGNPETLGAALNAPVEVESSYPYRLEAVPGELDSVSSTGPLTVRDVDLDNLEAVVRELGSVTD